MERPTTTSDGRWIVVDGRRWRATDPSIPEPLRKELVDELMAQRRAIAAARRDGDEEAESAARARVQPVKVALGERGEAWWDPTPEGRRARVRAAVLSLARHRGPERSICPSDAARIVGGAGWRDRLPDARDAARALARDGEVRILQRGNELDPDAEWSGPVRVRAR